MSDAKAILSRMNHCIANKQQCELSTLLHNLLTCLEDRAGGMDAAIAVGPESTSAVALCNQLPWQQGNRVDYTMEEAMLAVLHQVYLRAEEGNEFLLRNLRHEKAALLRKLSAGKYVQFQSVVGQVQVVGDLRAVAVGRLWVVAHLVEYPQTRAE